VERGMSKRRHRGGHEGGHENAERWLVSYADFITLLMVFFVVLYSMSQQDSTKFKRISASLQQAFNLEVLQGQAAAGISDGGPTMSPPIDDLINDAEVPTMQRLQNKVQAVVRQMQEDTKSGDQVQAPDVTVGMDKEGIVIRLSGSYLFDSGRAELKSNSIGIIDAIASEIKLLPNDIRVDGHTDSTPIDSPRYPTNWELSVARSVAVARYLIEGDGVRADRVTAAGHGEFQPLVLNDTREHRAQNRRVEIHLLSSASPAAIAETQRYNSTLAMLTGNAPESYPTSTSASAESTHAATASTATPPPSATSEHESQPVSEHH
jgi:chemotaxis protein MotB